MKTLAKTKLSSCAWKSTAHIFNAILEHPFNQELMRGTLARDKFAYYIEQDTIYLQDFARCHALIASKIPFKHTKIFLKYAECALIAEQEVVHQFFKDIFDFTETGLVSPATVSYTSYLLSRCTLDEVEVAVAAVLPCFWIYREVGLHIAIHSTGTNPYTRWIETYTGKEFGDLVTEAIGIFDCVAEAATEKVRQRMLAAFYKSTCLEWHFWNDAYNKTVFDKF